VILDFAFLMALAEAENHTGLKSLHGNLEVFVGRNPAKSVRQSGCTAVFA
jgi:hypothetical protein